MSGIAGIFNLNNLPIQHKMIASMLEKMKHRGQDDQGIWLDQFIGMGHCLLRTTPESLQEKQPLISRNTKNAIACHGRLDNREELLGYLKIDYLRNAPDVELILAAYEKWGIECLKYLVGVYAFAIWDQQKERLFCGRDVIGICPFHYHFNGKRLIWASEIQPLWEDKETPQAINDEMLIKNLMAYSMEYKKTFFKDIYRLPPAHYLVLNREGKLIIERYWDLDVNQTQEELSEAEYIEKFLGLFQQAIKAQLRSISPVGALMSGGIDSTSVVAMAQRIYQQENSTQKIFPLSAIFNELTSVDEREWMEAVIEQYNLPTNFLVADSYYSFNLEKLPNMPPPLEEPLSSIYEEVSYGLLGQGKQLGTKVVLTGMDGDLLLEGSGYYLTDLLLEGHWGKLMEELNYYPKKFLWRGIRRWLISPFWTKMIKPSLRLLNRPIIENSLISIPFWLNAEQVRKIELPLINEPHFANLAIHNEYEKYMSADIANRIIYYQNAALYYQVELRHPFFDRRLVEFLFQVPIKFKRGMCTPKLLLREAMLDILPNKIVDFNPNFSRGNFHGVLDHGLREILKSPWQKWLENGYLVNLGYVDQSKLLELVNQYGQNHSKRHDLAKIIKIERWLKKILQYPEKRDFILSKQE